MIFHISCRFLLLQLYCLMITTPARFDMRDLAINFKNVKHLHNDNMVEGFPSIQTFDGVCVGCLVGKHPEKKYDVGKAHRVVSTLDLTHSDVVGPMPTNSINIGSRYFLTFIDDCSMYCWIYFMKLTSEVFETFKSFKDMVENIFNNKIKSIRSDRGGEYVKRDF